MRRQESHSVSKETMIGGLLIGTAIGAAAAYLFSSRGAPLRESLAEKCCQLSDEARRVAEQIAERSASVSEDISDRLFNNTHRSNDQLNWVIGGIGATILGVAAYAYLSQDSKEARGNLLHTFQTITNKTSRLASDLQDSVHDASENLEDHVTCWVKTAQRFLDTVNGYAKTAAHKASSLREESTLDKAVDWASFGIRLFQSLRK